MDSQSKWDQDFVFEHPPQQQLLPPLPPPAEDQLPADGLSQATSKNRLSSDVFNESLAEDWNCELEISVTSEKSPASLSFQDIRETRRVLPQESLLEYLENHVEDSSVESGVTGTSLDCDDTSEPVHGIIQWTHDVTKKLSAICMASSISTSTETDHASSKNLAKYLANWQDGIITHVFLDKLEVDVLAHMQESKLIESNCSQSIDTTISVDSSGCWLNAWQLLRDSSLACSKLVTSLDGQQFTDSSLRQRLLKLLIRMSEIALHLATALTAWLEDACQLYIIYDGDSKDTVNVWRQATDSVQQSRLGWAVYASVMAHSDLSAHSNLKALCLTNILFTNCGLSPLMTHNSGFQRSNSLVSPPSLRDGDVLDMAACAAAAQDQQLSPVALIEQCIQLLKVTPSPSAVRAKLCYGVCRYLHHLHRRSLTWQQHDNSAEWESGILDMYVSAFGASEEVRVTQLLMFESVVDLLPSPSSSLSPAQSTVVTASAYSVLCEDVSMMNIHTKDDGYLLVSDLTCLVLQGLTLSVSESGSCAVALALTELHMLFITAIMHVQSPSFLQYHRKSLALLTKSAALLAVKAQKSVVAIRHCKNALDMLKADGNVQELLYVSDILATQLENVGNCEAAIDVLRAAVSITTQVHLSDALLFRIGRMLLSFGCPDKAALEFQGLLVSLCDRGSTPGLRSKKVSLLTWLLQCYLDLENADICKKIIFAIKSLRADVAFSDGVSLVSIINNTVSNVSTISSPDIFASPCLPKFCVPNRSLDLGEVISRIHLLNRQYTTALRQLLPTIMFVELVVNEQQATVRASVLELARLYSLRGLIQFEAAKSPQKSKFPVSVGSSTLFTAVSGLFKNLQTSSSSSAKFDGHNEHNENNNNSRHAKDEEDEDDINNYNDEAANAQQQQQHVIFSRKRTWYTNTSDLLACACRWFKRSSKLFKDVGDELAAAEAGNMIAKCHLEELFVPFAFFHTPVAEDTRPPMVLKRLAPPFATTTTAKKPKFGSLVEVQRVLDFSLNVSVGSCVPFLLFDMYLNLAELRILQDESFEATAFWWEARDLFLHLFTDGALIPLLRRAPMPFIRQLTSLCDRLVRFLFQCERQFVNENLLLLDQHLMMTIEADRARRLSASTCRWASRELDVILVNIKQTGDGTATAAIVSRDKSISALFVAGGGSLVQFLQRMYSTASSTLDQGAASAKDSAAGAATDVASADPALIPPELPRFAPSPHDKFRHNSNRPWDKLFSFYANGSSVCGTATSAKGEEPRAVRSVELETDFPWLTEQPTVTGGSEDDLRVQQAWRCCALLLRTQWRYHQSPQSGDMTALRETSRKILRAMSLTMCQLRIKNKSIRSGDMSYNDLFRGLVVPAKNTAADNSSVVDIDVSVSKAVSLVERLEQVVYVLQIGSLLCMHRPKAGPPFVQMLRSKSNVSVGESESNGQENGPTSGSGMGYAAAVATGYGGNSVAMHSNSDSIHAGMTVQGQQGPEGAVDLRDEECHLMFDLAMEHVGATCFGGPSMRKNQLDQFRIGSLKFALQFISHEAECVSVSTGSCSFGKRPLPQDHRNMSFGALLPTGLLRLLVTQKAVAPPPLVSSAVTLLCSKNLQALPWECLVDARVVRHICLYSLMAGKSLRNDSSFTTGPDWDQQPCFVSFAQGLVGLPAARLTPEVKCRDVVRRASGAITRLSSLHMPTAVLSASASSVLVLPDHSKIQMSPQAHEKYCAICEGYQQRSWPGPSPLLPLGKTSGQSLRSRRLRRFNFFDLNQIDGRGPEYLRKWFETISTGPNNNSATDELKTANTNPFPLVVLAYSDLMDMSDAIVSLLTERRDTVCVFAPHFCAGYVAKEIVRNIDCWCVEPAVAAAAGQAGQGTALSSTSATANAAVVSSTSSATGGGGGLVQRPKQGAGVQIGGGESSSTLVYHAVMDAVARLQQEHFAPIAVFM